MVEVTTDPMESRLSWQEPWTAIIVFHVSGVTHDDQALEAVDAVTGLRVPKRNDPHPRSARLRCVGPTVREKKGAEYWIIEAQFVVPPNGTLPGAVGLDPFLGPPKWRWETLEMNEPVDVDLDNRPIVNLAGEPYDPPSRPIAAKRFIFSKNFPYYNAGQAEAFENTENGSAVMLPDGTVVPQYRCFCQTICPVGESDQFSEFQRIVMTFLVVLGNQLGPRPFQHRFLNNGRTGWRTVNAAATRGALTTNVGGIPQPVQSKILLDSEGKPLASEGPVKVEGGDPVANPSIPSPLQTQDLGGGRIALIYRAVATADHNSLFS